MIFEQIRDTIAQRRARPLLAGANQSAHSSDLDVSLVLFITGVWFAVVTGITEFILLALANVFLRRYIYYFGLDLLWKIPLADLIIFALPGFILFGVSRLWPRLVSLGVIVSAYAYFSFLSLLLLYTPLARIAAVVLAGGLAVQVGRWVAAHPEHFFSLARITLGWMVIANRQPRQETAAHPVGAANSLTRRQFLLSAGTTVAGLALGVRGWETLAESRTLASLPPAAAGQPNVLLIVLDTVRALNLGLYGYHRTTTPQLERLAKAGVVFDRAVSAASWTLPSHACMFTGRYPHELSVGYQSPLDSTFRTLAEVLSAQGYQTAGFVSNVWYCSQESGLGRGFAHYEDFNSSPTDIINSSSLGRAVGESAEIRRAIGYYEELGRKPAPEVSQDFMSWLSQRDEQRPFFAFLNYFDAHEPYFPPEPFNSLFGAPKPRENPRHGVGWNWSVEQVQAEIDAYDGSIAYLDNQIGILFDTLRKRGLLNNTLVVIASDHGEEFREHGVMDHGYSLYWPVLNVLLMLSFPQRVPAGMRVQNPVTLRDLPATILNLVGLEEKWRFPGSSLTRFWTQGGGSVNPPDEIALAEVNSNPGYPSWYPVTRGDIKSLVVDRSHYIRNGDGREELYNLDEDPWEQRNLAGSANGQRMVSELRQLLASFATKS